MEDKTVTYALLFLRYVRHIFKTKKLLAIIIIYKAVCFG